MNNRIQTLQVLLAPLIKNFFLFVCLFFSRQISRIFRRLQRRSFKKKIIDFSVDQNPMYSLNYLEIDLRYRRFRSRQHNDKIRCDFRNRNEFNINNNNKKETFGRQKYSRQFLSELIELIFLFEGKIISSQHWCFDIPMDSFGKKTNISVQKQNIFFFENRRCSQSKSVLFFQSEIYVNRIEYFSSRTMKIFFEKKIRKEL